MKNKLTFEERYWSKVDKRGPDECWPWTASVFKTGYGQFKFNNKTMKAHRIAMILSGFDPTGLVVLHSCDNPRCVNPAHLSLGTQQDNMDDMREKGRSVMPYTYKDRAPKQNRKLTMDDARAIRNSNMTQLALAKQYGVHQGTIRQIIKNMAYKEVP